MVDNGNQGEQRIAIDMEAPANGREKPLIISHQETVQAAASQCPARERLYSLDMVRGIIIVIMAWDHCRDFIGIRSAGSRGPGETWSGPAADYQNSIVIWSSRFVSHVCAPGFMFMMGYGMAILVTSRLGRGWSVLRIMRHFLLRGLVIMLAERVNNVVMQLARAPATGKFPPGAALFLGFLWVLNVLGEVMILVGCIVVPILVPLRHLGTAGRIVAHMVLAAVVIVNFVVSSYCIENAQGNDPLAKTPWPRFDVAPDGVIQVLLRFFLYPGNLINNHGIVVPIAYVIFPWMGVACFGMSMGFVHVESPAVAQRLCGPTSICLFVAFLLVRTVGGSFGNIIGLPVKRDEGSSVPFISFFTLSKYPPSLAFCLITLGIDIGLLYIFGTVAFTRYVEAGRGARLMNAILSFGRVPFFFFICHLWLISLASGVIYAVSKGLPLPALLPAWLVLLLVMYPLCKRYNTFKLSTDENSLWRLF